MTRWSVAAVLLLLLAPSSARADDASDCIDANEKAIRLRKEHKLLDARVANARCAALSCPADLRPICNERSDKINQAIPSILFEVRDGAGRDMTGVAVTVDGAPPGTDPTVTALELDAGPHTFVFTAAGQTVERSYVLREGDKQRREPIAIGAAPAAPTATSVPPLATSAPAPAAGSESSPLRTVGLWIGGVGVVGLAVGSLFGVMASSAWNTAKQECPSHTGCSAQAMSDHNNTTTFGTVSTVGFIAGGVLLAGGVTLFLVAPRSEAPSVGLQAGPGSFAVTGAF